MISSDMTNQAILAELGERVRHERLNQNITQEQLARHSGVARTVVQSLESGRGCALSGLVRILRGLGLLEQLDVLLPEPGPSPVQLARLAGAVRRRASGRRGSSEPERS